MSTDTMVASIQISKIVILNWVKIVQIINQENIFKLPITDYFD